MSGYCQCGCGVRTRIATRNKANRGHVKGFPIRYLVGHGSRLSPVEYLEKDTGYKSPCWLWQRSLRPNGYGQIPINGTPRYAHIVYFERKHGAVPRGKMLDHLCRIRKCVNPDHMEAVSNQANAQRGSRAKLSPDAVRMMRELKKQGASNVGLAKIFGVCASTAHYACSSQTWDNVK